MNNLTLSQANARLSLSRALAAAVSPTTGNTVTVYEPFAGINVKLVRAHKNSRWYIYATGKRLSSLAMFAYGDANNIIYVEC